MTQRTLTLIGVGMIVVFILPADLISLNTDQTYLASLLTLAFQFSEEAKIARFGIVRSIVVQTNPRF